MYRTTTIALALAATLTACADATAPTPTPAVRSPGAPSLAQSSTRQNINEWFDIAGTIVNPCNREPVAYTGKIHENGYVDYDGTNYDLKLHINVADLHGTGLTTGDSYTGSEQVKEAEMLNFDQFTGTASYRDKFLLISNSPTDNFYSTFAYTIDFTTGTFTITQDEARCTG